MTTVADDFLRGQIAAAMAQLIAVREDLMVDEGTVTRPAAQEQTPVLDGNGMPVGGAAVTVYTEMPCTVADPSSALVANRTVTDQAGVPNRRTLRTPHRFTLLPGDLFTVTAASISPGLVGDTFLVIGEEERSYGTYRRYVLRGSSWLSSPA
jgi:hypothetical protein